MKLSSTSIPYLVIVALVIMFAAIARAQNVQDWEEHDVPLVGRISHLEGTLSRYDADQDEWVVTFKDAPVGAGDRLYSDPDAKVELILPNNTWIRMDGDTEIKLTALDETYTEMDITLGTARLYNKSSTAQIKTTTPFGYVITPAGSDADLYVYSDGIDIIALNNQVYFVHNRSERRHEITDRGAALFADTHEVSTGRAEVASDWDKWNEEMDALWAMRTRTRGESSAYLPPALQYDAYFLDTHGCWDLVYYHGDYYRFWRPVHVHVGWSPFSSGYWHVWWGDHVWIPLEPFGYVTHHYGNWIFTGGYWYWAPPVTRAMIHAGLPLFHIGFAWYPGRVAWIHTGVYVGWFPLAPYEPYYCHRHWGRRSYMVTKHGHRYNHRYSYQHRRHAVVIHKAHLYRGKNYRDARVKNISRVAATGQFRTAPVLDRSVVPNYRLRSGTKRLNQRSDVRKRQPDRTRESRLNRRTTRKVTPDPRLDRRTGPAKVRSRTLDQRSSPNNHNRKPGVSTRDRKLQNRNSRKAPPAIQPLPRTQTRTTEKAGQPKPGKKRFVKKDTPAPVKTRTSKAQRSRQPDIGQQSTGKRLSREAIHKATRQSSAGRSSANQRPAHPNQIRSLHSGRTAFTPNRPDQPQGRVQGNSHRGYAPRNWQNDRMSGFRSSGSRGFRRSR